MRDITPRPHGQALSIIAGVGLALAVLIFFLVAGLIDGGQRAWRAFLKWR